jgi:hypothetical protein
MATVGDLAALSVWSYDPTAGSPPAAVILRSGDLAEILCRVQRNLERITKSANPLDLIDDEFIEGIEITEARHRLPEN